MNLYILHAMTEGDRADAWRMRFSTSHETFSSRFADTRSLQHRMRAGIGLSPAEYSEAFCSEPGRVEYERDVAARPTYHDGRPRRQWHELDSVARWSWAR